MIKLGAKELRGREPTKQELTQIKRQPIYLVLDNVLDTYNVGAIFRLADAVAAEKIYLCGQTEIPPNHKIVKASVGTWKWVSWQYSSTAVEAVKNLKLEVKNVKIIAVEQHEKSVRFNNYEYKLPLCLVVGNETDGISKETLKMCDAIVELPMFGINKSLNVMVALGIVLYKVIDQLQ